METFDLERISVESESTAILQPLEKGTKIYSYKTAKEYVVKKFIKQTGSSVTALVKSGDAEEAKTGNTVAPTPPPVPKHPTADGEYKLKVLKGVATWVTV